MEPVARGCLSDLSKECLRVPVDQQLEGVAACNQFGEDGRLQSKPVAGDLGDCAHSETGQRLDERDAHHSLVADGGHLNESPRLHRSDERDHTVGREVHRLDGTAGLEQHGADVQRDLGRRVEELLTFRQGQSGNDPVLAWRPAVSAAVFR